MSFIELHVKGKKVLFNTSAIMAVLPDKTAGSLICETLTSYIHVDENVDAIHDLIDTTLEVEMIAND